MAGQASQLIDLKKDEMVARSAIYPKYMDMESGVFSKRALLAPDALDPDDKKRTGVLAISVASMTLLSDEEQVHKYGCRTAASQNRRVFASFGIFSTIDKRKFYRGFYDMNVDEITSINSGKYLIEVKSVPEHGEDAHCEIRLVPNPSATTKELKNARSDILIDLGNAFKSVSRHSCLSDDQFSSYTADMELPEAQIDSAL